MATSSKKKTFVNKDDLKRLMKEKKSTLGTSKKRIESPLAKYDSLGQLHCALCGCKVKNELLWNAHISGRTHKENLAHLKDQQNKKAEERLRPADPHNAGTKRKLPTRPEGQNKLHKADTQGAGVSSSSQGSLPSDFFDATPSTSVGGLQNLGRYGEPDTNDNENSTGIDTNVSSNGSKPQVEGLPADFFDTGIPPSRPIVDETESSTEATPGKTMAEQIPEGFFDDAKLDAKVRQVEYKDKMEDEWEMFQRAMKEENQVSEALQEEDNETVQVERNIEEIDEQIYHWSKVEELHQKKEKVMTSQVKSAQVSSDDASDSETDMQDFEEFLDWRSKRVR